MMPGTILQLHLAGEAYLTLASMNYYRAVSRGELDGDSWRIYDYVVRQDFLSCYNSSSS